MFDFLNKKKSRDYLRSGNGELLEVKVGVVVDESGKPVGPIYKQGQAFAQRARGFFARGGWPLTLAGAFAIPVALFAGLAALTLVGGFAAVFVVLMLIESAFGIGVRPNQRRG